MNVEEWLTELGLKQYAAAFAENGVDPSLLSELINDDLKDLGVDRLVDRKTILKAIAQLSQSDAEPTAMTTIAGERRQITVLFADIAGYTELSSELGAEENHTLRNPIKSIVEGYGGSVDKHEGDNVTALFGAPIAHDDDPLCAVRAALDIQERMTALSKEADHPLQTQIGIASGEVVASGTGSEAHFEHTVTKAVVNLASRVLEMAGPAQTLCSDAVYLAVVYYVDCDRSDEITVESIDGDKPVPVWRVKSLKRYWKVTNLLCSAHRRIYKLASHFFDFFDVAFLCLFGLLLILLHLLDQRGLTLFAWGFVIGAWVVVPLYVVIARVAGAVGWPRSIIGLFGTSIVGIFLFARIYEEHGVLPSAVENPTEITGDPLLSIYFSIVTWTTLGYGDFKPDDDVRGFAAVEAVLGYLVMAVFIGLIVSLFHRRLRPNSITDKGD